MTSPRPETVFRAHDVRETREAMEAIGAAS
jgi:dihydropteroate synthase